MITSVAYYFERKEPNWKIPESKTETWLLLFLVKGKLKYTVEDKPFFMEKGDILLVPQGISRSVENSPTEPHEMYLFRFYYDGGDAGLPIVATTRPTMVRPSQFDYMKQRFSLAVQHWLRKSKYSEIVCHSILMEILALLNEEIDSKMAHGKSYSHVIKLQNYILQHYRRPIPVSELAEQIGRTPNYVSAIFRQATGQTVSSYIQQIRITAACDLLINSHMSIGEVSDFLGFCEHSYFYKVFKRVTGMLPSAYRNEKVQFGIHDKPE